MRADNDSIADGRRAELGDFLRRRRAELTRDVAGLPTTRRRRTPGLRREEVAELANISTALYAWLEQGRDVPISRRTADAIATALQFTPSERDHVYALATNERTDLHEDVSATLERMVGSLRTHPIFVINHKWDIVLYNRAAQVVFDCGGDDVPQMNLLEVMFEDQRKALFVNWREVASSLVELFRYDYALYATEPGPLALVERLRGSDETFAAIWDEHRVRRTPTSVRRLNHQIAGLVSLEPSLFAVIESPGLRAMIYTPGDAHTEHQISALVAASLTRNQRPTISGTPSSKEPSRSSRGTL
jgi:transcriptional regulator with XRE-family HTH domain